VSQEFNLGEVEVDFISFVPRGANRKKYFIVKEDRELKEDILKAILETDEGEISRILKETRLEGEAAEVLESAAKLLKAYRDELPEYAMQILAKACGLQGPEPKEKIDASAGQTGAEGKTALSKESISRMEPQTQAIVKQLLDENNAIKAEAQEARKIAKELKDEKILKEYIEKAGDLPNLPIEILKFAPVMKALGEEHPAEFAEVYRVLKAADALLEKSAAFSEIGKAGQAGSAEARIYAKARAMVAKDCDLTFEEAIEKVMDLEPELYQQAEAERQEKAAKRGAR